MNKITKMFATLFAAAAALAGATHAAAQEKPVVDRERVLVVYYSWSGNTRQAAQYIAEHTGAHTMEIVPVKPYSKDYNECVEQAKKEVQTEATPEIKTPTVDLNKYDVVFIGTPNWWSSIAPPVRTFLEKNNFAGKKVALFVTHGSGGMARCEKDAKELLSKATMLRSAAFEGSSISSAKEAVTKWVDGIISIRR